MIILMEDGDFAGLPAKTYATGFTRSYARAVGLDENELVEAVRRELGMSSPLDSELSFSLEPGDPARVPTARFAWVLALGAVAVVAAGLFFWRTYYAPAMTLPSILPAATEAASGVAVPQADASAIDPEASFSAVASDEPNPAFTYAPAARTPSRPQARIRRDHRVGPAEAQVAQPDQAAPADDARSGPSASTVSN
jgi:cytoskeletal protein RodZ